MRRWKRKDVFVMRGIYRAIKGAMLGGMILVLSASPALAFGANKVLDEKPMVEINKIEKVNKIEKANKVEQEKLQVKKAEEPVVMKMNSHLGLGELLGEGILDEDILGLEE